MLFPCQYLAICGAHDAHEIRARTHAARVQPRDPGSIDAAAAHGARGALSTALPHGATLLSLDLAQAARFVSLLQSPSDVDRATGGSGIEIWRCVMERV